MEDFNFNEAEVSKGKTFLEPGNHEVTVTSVTKGLSAQKQTPFVEVTVTDKDGGTCAHQYYLTTTVAPGKEKSAWFYSASAILTLVMAATNKNEADAKLLFAGMNADNIDSKLASILVGKPFAITLMGTWVNPEDPGKKSWIKGSFGSFLFAVPLDQIKKLSNKVYIKGEEASAATAPGVVTDAPAW